MRDCAVLGLVKLIREMIVIGHVEIVSLEGWVKS